MFTDKKRDLGADYVKLKLLTIERRKAYQNGWHHSIQEEWITFTYTNIL